MGKESRKPPVICAIEAAVSTYMCAKFFFRGIDTLCDLFAGMTVVGDFSVCV